MRIKLSLIFLTYFICAQDISSSIKETEKLLVKNNKVCQALFTPDNDIKEVLINLIDSEQKGLSIAIYFLTDLTITQAIIRAFKRNIKMEIITDITSILDKRFSKIWKLFDNGIDILIFGEETNSKETKKPNGIMHNKFIIFEKNLFNKSFVCTGSFNYTYSAQEKNMENILISEDPFIVKRYKKAFKSLRSKTKSIKKFLHLKPIKQKTKFKDSYCIA